MAGCRLACKSLCALSCTHEARSRALLIISVLCLLGIGLDFVAPDISIIEGLQDRLFKDVAA